MCDRIVNNNLDNISSMLSTIVNLSLVNTTICSLIYCIVYGLLFIGGGYKLYVPSLYNKSYAVVNSKTTQYHLKYSGCVHNKIYDVTLNPTAMDSLDLIYFTCSWQVTSRPRKNVALDWYNQYKIMALERILVYS